jgi:hypothetical protein
MTRSNKSVVCESCGNQFMTASNNRKHCSPECKVRSVAKLFCHGKDDCWNWPLSVNPKTGYGHFSFHESKKYALKTAHVYSYRAFNGDTKGLHVLHKCDNRQCFNPAHLFLGTQRDNLLDMLSKNRRDYTNPACGERHGSKLHPERVARGERQGSAKLTAQDVMYARISPDTSSSIARSLGVSVSTICNIRKGKVWKHLILAS